MKVGRISKNQCQGVRVNPSAVDPRQAPKALPRSFVEFTEMPGDQDHHRIKLQLKLTLSGDYF
jgi:hypothetical protein